MLVVTSSSPFRVGGVERVVRELSVRLHAAGVPLSVICGDTETRTPHTDDLDGVPVRALPAYPQGKDWFVVPRLWQELAAARCDVVHVQGYHTLMPPLAMTRTNRLGIPFVLSFHGGGSSSSLRAQARGTQRFVQRPLYRRARRLVAIAPWEIEVYSEELGVPRDRFVLIPNGTDIAAPEGSADPPSGPQAPEAETLLASIGRLERYKGHHRVIAAMPELLKRRPNTRLLIVGTGPYEQDLRAAAAATGAGAQIEFTSVAPGDGGGMARLLASIDLVSLMSEFETHPLVALESAAARRRMVVARTRGLTELAEEGFGRPVPLDISPAALAAVYDEELAKPTPTRTPELLSWDDCAAAHLQLYRDVVSGARRR